MSMYYPDPGLFEWIWDLLLGAFAVGYLLGAIPFGMLLAKLFGLGNLREVGSGNIGATNVLRTGNKFAALLTLLLDAGKGLVVVLIAREYFGETTAQFAGLGAFLGHLFPLWLLFRGGKGVATFLGVMLGLNWTAGLVVCGVWLLVALLLRYSSLAALVAAFAAPVTLIAFGPKAAVWLAIVMLVLIVIRHIGNIKRLLAGQESRIRLKR